MARRSLTGQLNMFELFGNLEAPGEVQMVSLMPEDEPEVEVEPVVEVEPEVEAEPVEEAEPVIEAEPVVEAEPVIEVEPVVRKAPLKKKAQVSNESVAMSREMLLNGETVEIAYINYNKVRIVRGKGEPEVYEFASSKEAVDFYVEKMQEYLPDDEE